MDKDRQLALNEIKEKPSYKIYIIDFRISINDSPLTHYDLQFVSNPLMSGDCGSTYSYQVDVLNFNYFFERSNTVMFLSGYDERSQTMRLYFFTSNLNKEESIHSYQISFYKTLKLQLI